jgi:monosaccharide-transporting ATPase
LCGLGMALLVSSSELEEVVAFSHKVIVLRDRKQVAELEGGDIREDKIMQVIAADGVHA